jgi:hypothetical protein
MFWEDTCFGRTHVLGGHVFWEDTSFGRTRLLGGHVFWEDTSFGRTFAVRCHCHDLPKQYTPNPHTTRTPTHRTQALTISIDANWGGLMGGKLTFDGYEFIWRGGDGNQFICFRI